MPTLEYHPARPRGAQWTLTDDAGRRHERISATVVKGVLTRAGVSVREADAMLAETRLNANRSAAVPV